MGWTSPQRLVHLNRTTPHMSFHGGSRDEHVVPLLIAFFVYHCTLLSSARWHLPHSPFLNSKLAHTETSILPVIMLQKRTDIAQAQLELNSQLFFMRVSVLILMNGSWTSPRLFYSVSIALLLLERVLERQSLSCCRSYSMTRRKY